MKREKMQKMQKEQKVQKMCEKQRVCEKQKIYEARKIYAVWSIQKRAGFTLLEMILSITLFCVVLLGVIAAVSGMTRTFARSLEADREYAVLEQQIREGKARGRATGEQIEIEFEMEEGTVTETFYQYRTEKDGYALYYYR